jgi:hypothetical protein
MTASQFFLLTSLLSLQLITSSCSESPAGKSSDVVTRLCQHIAQKRQKMIVDTNQTEIVWSDGAILEVGTNFPGDLQELVSKPTHYHDIGSFVKKFDIGDAFEWREAFISTSSRRDGFTTIASLDGATTASVEPLYVEYLGKRYPTASIRIKGQFEPIIFIVHGRIQAVVMPVKF